MKVLHIITALGTGGAELFLLRLLENMPPHVESEVISLSSTEPTGERIRALGVSVSGLGMRPGVPDPRVVLKLAAIIRKSRPDVVHTWLYHADLIGGLAGWLAGVPVIWCLRTELQSDRRAVRETFKASTLAVIRLCAAISRVVPDVIVCCAGPVRTSHARAGYDASKLEILHNGIDTRLFSPSGGQAVRAELGLGHAPVVGMIGRFHQHKNQKDFIAMASAISARRPDVRFVMAGPGVTLSNPDFSSLLSDHGLAPVVHALGDRRDVAALADAFDILVSPSLMEGFPNVIAEAMACGTPCVTSDVGDAALIVGATGSVVPPKDVPALVNAVDSLLELPPEERRALGAAARKRIIDLFDIGAATARYVGLYERVTQRRRSAAQDVRVAA